MSGLLLITKAPARVRVLERRTRRTFWEILALTLQKMCKTLPSYASILGCTCSKLKRGEQDRLCPTSPEDGEGGGGRHRYSPTFLSQACVDMGVHDLPLNEYPPSAVSSHIHYDFPRKEHPSNQRLLLLYALKVILRVTLRPFWPHAPTTDIDFRIRSEGGRPYRRIVPVRSPSSRVRIQQLFGYQGIREQAALDRRTSVYQSLGGGG